MKRLLVELFVPALLGPGLILAVSFWNESLHHALCDYGMLIVAVPLLVGPGLIASVPYTFVMECAFRLGLPPDSHESQALSILLGAGAGTFVWHLFEGFGSHDGVAHFELMKFLPAAGVGAGVGLVTALLVQRVSRQEKHVPVGRQTC